MGKYLVILILLKFMSLKVSAAEDRGLAKVCADFEKVADIMTPYMQQAWAGISATPAGPTPTVTYFVYAGRQPIADFCSFITQLKSLTSTEQAFAAADYANKLSGDQHNEKIDFLRQTYDLGVALNHFNNGNRDVTQAMSLHRRINAYLKSADRFFNGDSASTFEERNERERKMSLLVRSSNQIAILKTAATCPSPKIAEEEKNMAYYQKEIVPLYPYIEEMQEDASYFMAQLQYLGTLISPGYEDHQIYQKEVYELFSNGVTYRRSDPKTKNVTTIKGNVKGTLKLTYYSYGTSLNSRLFSQFDEKYRKQWTAYVVAHIRAKNILVNPMSTAARKFRDTAYECRRNRIEWQLRRSSPMLRYEQADSAKFKMMVDKKVAQCKEDLVIDDKKVENLFTHYVNSLKRSLSLLKMYNSKLWSYESEYLGQNRIISTGIKNTDLGDVSTESVNCEEKLNTSESVDIKNRLEQESLNLRAMAAEEFTKKTHFMEEEVKEKKLMEENRRRSESIQKEEESRRQKIEELMGDLPSGDIAL